MVETCLNVRGDLEEVMQNLALRTTTGCTQDTHIHHRHDDTLILPIHEYMWLHSSQYKQKTQHPSHPLHKLTTYFNTPRLKHLQELHNTHSHIPPHTHYNIYKNKHVPYTYIYISIHNILRTPLPHISISEKILPRITRHTFVQLSQNKHSIL